MIRAPSFEFVRVGDLECSDDDGLLGLVTYASNLIAMGDIESAAWRLADALIIIKRQFECDPEKRISGIHVATGMGAILDSRCV